MAREASMLFGIFGKKKSSGRPSHRRGGYPKPKRLPGVAKKWQPPVKEPTLEEAAESQTEATQGDR